MATKEQYMRSSEKQENPSSNMLKGNLLHRIKLLSMTILCKLLFLHFVALFSIRLPSSRGLMQLEFIRIE